MTVNDLIRRSLRSIGVLNHAEEPTAEEASDALQTLNDMLNAWIYEGMDLEFAADLVLTDALPYPDDHAAAFRYALAVELAPEFGVQPPPAVLAMAASYKEALKTRYLDPDTLAADAFLSPIYNPNGSGLL